MSSLAIADCARMRRTVLKDFWFPFLLFLSGTAIGFLGLNMTGNARRVVLSFAALLAFLAVLSFIWGDPVRGPFALMVHSDTPDTFRFQAGAVACGYPLKSLADGLDFSHCMGIPGKPIQLWVRKTWWSGLQIRLTLMGTGNQPLLIYDGKQIKHMDANFDLNHDDYALELVSPSRAPLFQLIISEDYNIVYVSALISVEPNTVIVIKEGVLANLAIAEAMKPQYKLDRLFKYPSYTHQGMRE
jgi:hypothetical protein